jgi:hypothetical protein
MSADAIDPPATMAKRTSGAQLKTQTAIQPPPAATTRRVLAANNGHIIRPRPCAAKLKAKMRPFAA